MPQRAHWLAHNSGEGDSDQMQITDPPYVISTPARAHRFITVCDDLISDLTDLARVGLIEAHTVRRIEAALRATVQGMAGRVFH
jgi:hypothetical protein